jgi:predicted acyl esterase
VGEPALDLWVKCDAPDADLAVLVYEVLEDGGVIFLSSSQLRLRHRDGGDETMPTNAPVLLSFPQFRFVARRIARNSRLRLVVRATACSFMQKNLNSATPVAEQQPGEERVAKIQVLHDLVHRSILRLPTSPEAAH